VVDLDHFMVAGEHTGAQLSTGTTILPSCCVMLLLSPEHTSFIPWFTRAITATTYITRPLTSLSSFPISLHPVDTIPLLAASHMLLSAPSLDTLKPIVHSKVGKQRPLFEQVQDHCCARNRGQPSSAAESELVEQYITAHEPLISRYTSLFLGEYTVPRWQEVEATFEVQLHTHITDFSAWLTDHSYVSSHQHKKFGFRLLVPLPVGNNMFDALLQRDVNLHDAYVMDISLNADFPPTFTVYREMQDLAPPIVKRILGARVMQLSKEEERKAISEALRKKRKRGVDSNAEGEVRCCRTT
jgi:hypothetical protein